MKRLRLIPIIFAMFACASAAHAHPLGSRFFGHRMTVTLSSDSIKLTYVIEIPASKLAVMMDRFRQQRGRQGWTTDDEREFNREMLDHVRSNLSLTVADRRLPLVWDPNYAPTQGAGDYLFFEYRLHLIADVRDMADASFPFSILNENFMRQQSVFYNEIKHLPGAHASDANIPASMQWSQDTRYRLVSATYRRGDAHAVDSSRYAFVRDDARGRQPLIDLMRRRDMTSGLIAAALITALFLGCVHALSPGHGKALVAAYLVGSRGTVAHAATLGLVVTVTHVSSVIVLGVVSLVAARYIVPEYYMPFISLISGLAIVGIGVWLIVQRLKGLSIRAEHDCLDPAHEHGHAHHHHGHGHADVGLATLIGFGITGGIVPCPSALVVMLTAIAIGRIAFGLVLIVFFSLGLALTLTVIGIVAVRAARILDRFVRTKAVMRWLPLASAIVITVLGVLIAYQGFWLEWTALR